MATARIDAAKVIAAAEDKIAHHEAERVRAREEWFDRRLKEPVTEGALWWRREHYRTQAEVEKLYSSEKIVYTYCYWNEVDHIRRRGKAELLRDLARASMDGSVSLNEDEAHFLGLETDQ